MGFFSWNCKGCGESIKAPYDLPEAIGWQNDCVAITPGKNLNRGSYDGYGRIEGLEVDHDVIELWHDKCWSKAGCPTDYTEPSVYADDQGYFYDYEDEHNKDHHDIGGEG